MKILVTGAAGFIGSHLSERLLNKKIEVVGIDNFNDFYSPELKRQNLKAIQETADRNKTFFQCYSGDICDDDMLDSLFKTHQIEAIIHLAAMAGVRPSILNPALYERVNGLGTTLLLEAAKRHHIRHFIFGSSSSVYGLNKKTPFSETDPVELPYSPYAATKRANEIMALVYHQLTGINFALLRFFTVYGPRQRPDLAIRKFTDLMFKGQSIPILGDGSARRDFTYIDDIIDGIEKSLSWSLNRTQASYEIFNLGESATTSVLELVRLIEKASGIQAKLDFKPAQPGDVPLTFADVSKAKAVLGYDPQTPIEEGIVKFVDWYARTQKT